MLLEKFTAKCYISQKAIHYSKLFHQGFQTRGPHVAREGGCVTCGAS